VAVAVAVAVAQVAARVAAQEEVAVAEEENRRPHQNQSGSRQ
jgi:hypothetical protein